MQRRQMNFVAIDTKIISYIQFIYGIKLCYNKVYKYNIISILVTEIPY